MVFFENNIRVKKSVIHPKMPQRDNVLVTIFNVVFHDKGVRGLGDLFLVFAFSAHFKSLSFNEEIRNLRSVNLLIDLRF